ncbi:MAG: hypothetical protein CMF22_10210 [Idiomarinaceae bacterium]|nr:hypothetical protein [Idiomarinaceae bacterium]MBG23815.1 hypothetical protein [Idiomarinaceae bacterium]|tara:strand:- start:36936 stop:37208 length:273 start_codon:yes stop_codon:yes gene_type:complete
MKYPDKIYRKLEIVEKEIHGETFYGCVEHKSFLGLRRKKMVRIHQNIFNKNLGHFSYDGVRWVDSKKCVEDCIDTVHRVAELRFKRKVTK